MFGLSFAKNIKQKGVSMVEYAVMLAFVAVVAGVFMDDGGLKGGIQGSVDKVLVRLGVLEDKKDIFKISYTDSDYKTLITSLDGIYGKKQLDNGSFDYNQENISKILVMLKDHGGVLKSSDDNANQILKGLGIDVPDGSGNWRLALLDNNTDYQFTWTQGDANISDGTVKALAYSSLGQSTGGWTSVYTVGTVNLDTNGVIDSSVNWSGGYSTMKNPDNAYMYALDDFNKGKLYDKK